MLIITCFVIYEINQDGWKLALIKDIEIIYKG